MRVIERAGFRRERGKYLGLRKGDFLNLGTNRRTSGMTEKKQIIEVKGAPITIVNVNEADYISLTDMVRNFEDGLSLIEKWLRNKNTIEFLGIWERINNVEFNSLEFGGFKSEAGLNRFVLSVKK